MHSILLFIPMYNCEKQITRVIGQIDSKVAKYISEVIVVDNRSTDNGEKVVMNYLEENDLQISIKLLKNKENYGLGGSHKVAFQYAKANNFDYMIVLHGDDQGNIADILPLIKNEQFLKYDCILGARFMKGSNITGYSKMRIWGNNFFNILFSVVTKRKIYDLGSGLNMYRVNSFEESLYRKYPDTLYFNDLMILSAVFHEKKMFFFPISWREEDQISNNRIIKFSVSLLKMLFKYICNKKQYLYSEMREKTIDKYEAQIICEKGC